jgi:PKHD-type hydroxylase
MEPQAVLRLLSRDECAMVLQGAFAVESRPAEVVDGISDDRKGRVRWLRRRKNHEWLFDRLESCACAYAKSLGLDIDGIGEPIQIASYGVGDHFDWHVDVGDGKLRRRKITITVQLSSARDYSGGTLEFCTRSESLEHRALGCGLIFPSLLGHRVTPISQGRRHALVAWVHGPPLR